MSPSYTSILHFSDKATRSVNSPSADKRIKTVLIIGAGLAGLAAAIGFAKSDYDVTVLEKTPELQEIGAGIQIPANSSRVLHELGVLGHLERLSDKPRNFLIRSYRGKDLYTQNFDPSTTEEYGFAHLVIHRADFRRVLHDEALASGAKIQLGARVTDINFHTGVAHLDNGVKYSAELIIGVDGENSTCRYLLGQRNTPHSSGDVVFRISIPYSIITEDPSLKFLLDTPNIYTWYAPDSHAVCYPLKKDKILNVVLTIAEQRDLATTGPQLADIQILREHCKTWDSNFRRLLELADKAYKWTLLEMDHPEQWEHPSGKFILLGDAVHPVLPYLAQGAAMAIESAYILSELFSHHPPASAIPSLLRVFRISRQGRVSCVQERSKHMHDIWQLLDGPEQEERDRRLLEDEPGEGFPNLLADPVFQRWLWGFDAKRDAQDIQNNRIQGFR